MRMTVLVPANNPFFTIRGAMDSVLSRTLPPELISEVDDVHTDEMAAILDS
jgi:hypothetical protein